MLTDKDKLILLTFLANVIQLCSRFQQYLNKVCDEINYFRTAPLLGGWVSALNKGIENDDNGTQS